MDNTIHFILQGKGGIGKTFISSLLANYMRHRFQNNLKCFDMDQENATFTKYKALNVEHISVIDNNKSIDQKGFDRLIEKMFEFKGNCVIDTGSNTYSTLINYLKESDIIEMLESNGKTVYIHAVIGGAAELEDTSASFVDLTNQIKAPIVLWLNEKDGSTKGWELEEDVAETLNINSILGIVLLPERNQATFGADMTKMTKDRLTLNEVLDSADYKIMERQRIKTVFDDVFLKLDKVGW
jgi:dethiobiotin synthetase